MLLGVLQAMDGWRPASMVQRHSQLTDAHLTPDAQRLAKVAALWEGRCRNDCAPEVAQI